LITVNESVDFNDQPRGMAIKVDDEPVDDLLAAEMKSAELIPAEALPEYPFLGRRLPTHFLRPKDFLLRNPLADDDILSGHRRLISGR
jgi:hypothetical protein